MSELPRGWAQLNLGEVGRWQGGGTPSKSVTAYWLNGDIPWVSPKDMKTDIINDAEDHITFQAIAGSATQLIPSGAILIVTRSGILRRTLPVGRTVRDVTINQDLKALTPVKQVELEFAAHQIRASQRTILSTCAKSGTTVDSVDFEKLKAFPFLLPPIPEQRRIVAKIDSLTGKSRRARDHLDHIPRLVEKYKQAILAAAFRGDLTREWRLKNSETGEWSNLTLGEVVTIASGQTPKGIESKLESNGEIPWFKVSSMNDPENMQGFTTSKFRLSLSSAQSLGLKVFAAGSIAFPKRGGAIATNKKRKLLSNGALDLNIMVLTPKKVEGDFLWWWIHRLDLSTISNGSNVPQINNGDVVPLQISVPPVPEQIQIAKQVETAFAWIDRLAAEATSARKLIDHLDQAVLAKAFRGELVPQDPTDEPASVLLDRIRAEREAAPKAKRGRKKTA